MLTVRTATEADIISIASRLRAADLMEIQAGSGKPPEEVLKEGLKGGDTTLVAVDEEGLPHIIFGVYPHPSKVLGSVWMVASDGIRKHRKQLLRESRYWVNKLNAQYPALANAVHADNKIHIRWLKWTGFVFLREFTFKGHNFYEFARINRGAA